MMRSRRDKKENLRDWPLKYSAIRVAVNRFTHLEVARILDPDDPSGAYDIFRHWGERTPGQQPGLALLRKIQERLNVTREMTPKEFSESGVTDFILILPASTQLRIWRHSGFRQEYAERYGWDALPEEVEEIVPEDRGNSLAADAEDWDSHELVAFLADGRSRHDSIRKGIAARRIEQHHHYLVPDSANDWHRLVETESYATYDHCRDGLSVLFESPPWNRAVSANPPQTVVMLAGGGAPTKDEVVLEALLRASPRKTDKLKYVLVDTSYFMLNYSAYGLREYYRHLPTAEQNRLRIVYRIGDALNLRGLRNLCDPTQRKLFAITGGTIGNLSERKLFSSVAAVCKRDDLFIISADTVDGLSERDLESNLRDQYATPEVQRFLRHSIREVLDRCQDPRTPEEASKDLSTRISKDGRADGYSDIQNTRCVVLSLMSRGRSVVLATSTRYTSKDLILFAEGFGWECLESTPSPENANFVQFLFRRNETE